MKRRLIALVMVLLMTVFMVSMAVTVAFAKPPTCNRCIPEGCMGTHCYVNCADCCFWQLGRLYCER